MNSTARAVGMAGLLCVLAAWETPGSQARRYLKELTPARLHQSPTGKEPRRPTRDVRVRIYADAACAAGVNLKNRFKAFFKQVNDFATLGFNVRFFVHDVKHWDQKLTASQLDDMLAELAAMDPGEDVDLVVGCVSPLQLETTSTHEAGRAHLLGKHLVLRPLANVEEERSFREAFYALDEKEWSAVLSARAAHKQVAFFVHEWAHTLGALHEREPHWLLHPHWTEKQGAFSYINTRVMEIALRHRLEGAYDPTAEAKELVEFLSNFDQEWSKQDRDWLMKVLRARAAGQKVNVAIESPANAKKAVGATAAAPTPPASASAPRALIAALDEAEALLAANKFFEAQDAATKANALAEGANTLPPEVWVRIAEISLNLGAFTQGEAALAKAGSTAAEGAAQIFARARARVGLAAPRPSVPPELEATYSNRFWEIVGLLNDDKIKQAQAVLSKYAMFARTPAFMALACEVAYRQRKAAAARTRCEAALAEEPRLPRAHILLAALEEAAGKPDAAVAHWQTAISLDAEDKVPWHELSRLLAKAGKRTELQRLRDKYQAAFGEALTAR